MKNTLTNLLEKMAYETTNQINHWVDSNSLSFNSAQTWKIGITASDKILKIQRHILEDMESVHWKYWSFNSFNDAFGALNKLNKRPTILKSEYSEYLSKGSYIFIYKTRMFSTDYLMHVKSFTPKQSNF